MHSYVLDHAEAACDGTLDASLAGRGWTVEHLAYPEDHEQVIPPFLERRGGVVFVPAVWEDLNCIKVAGELLSLSRPYEVVLVGPEPPSASLVAAFNEGIAAYLTMPLAAERIEVILSRVETRLQRRLEALALDHAQHPAGRAHLDSPAERRLRDRSLGRAFLRCATPGNALFNGDARVLVAASSDSQQKHLVELLRKVGFAVDTARTVAEAVNAAQANPHLVIISDGQLPDGDAAAMAERLRKALHGPVPKMLVWSSSPESAERFLGPDSQIDEVLPKPTPEAGLEAVLPSIIAAAVQAAE